MKKVKKNNKPSIPSEKALARFERIMGWISSGKNNITNEDNISRGVKPYQPLKIMEALKEEGITNADWYQMLYYYPYFKERYDNFKEIRRGRLMEGAEANLLDAIEGRMDIEDKDKARLSFDIATKLIKEYNPKQEVGVSLDLNSMSDEDILDKIKELSYLIKGEEDVEDNKGL